MKKAKLSKVSVKTSDSGVKYLRLEYQYVAEKVELDGVSDDIMKLLDQVEENTARPLVDVMSAGKFNDDGTPDKEANEAWVEKMKPIFSALGKAGFVFDVETKQVPVEPYYRISKGQVNTSVIYEAIEIDCVLNPKTKLPWISNAFQSKADSRLRNGTNMYITVSAYKKKAEQQAEASSSDLDAITSALSTAVSADEEETF